MEVEGGESKGSKSYTNINSDVHHSKRRRSRKGKFICLGAIAFILLLIMIIIILAFTVFKAKKPVISVNSVSLQDLKFKLDFPIQVHLNVTLGIGISIRNPNKVSYKYSNSSAAVKFKDQVIGNVPIPSGKIKADSSTPLNLTVTVMADRLLTDSDVYSDVIGSGTLPITSYTRVKGKVRILKLFNIHVVSTSACDLKINIRNRSIDNETCQYRTKL